MLIAVNLRARIHSYYSIRQCLLIRLLKPVFGGLVFIKVYPFKDISIRPCFEVQHQQFKLKCIFLIHFIIRTFSFSIRNICSFMICSVQLIHSTFSYLLRPPHYLERPCGLLILFSLKVQVLERHKELRIPTHFKICFQKFIGTYLYVLLVSELISLTQYRFFYITRRLNCCTYLIYFSSISTIKWSMFSG